MQSFAEALAVNGEGDLHDHLVYKAAAASISSPRAPLTFRTRQIRHRSLMRMRSVRRGEPDYRCRHSAGGTPAQRLNARLNELLSE